MNRSKHGALCQQQAIPQVSVVLAKNLHRSSKIGGQTPLPTMTRKAQQDAANERRALARFYSGSLLRRPSRSDNASIWLFFFLCSGFPFIQPCKVRSSKGVEKGLWTNERLHWMVPHQGDEAQGTRHRWSWRRHLRYRQEVSTIMMPPVPGGGRESRCGYWMRGLFRHSVAAVGRK